MGSMSVLDVGSSFKQSLIFKTENCLQSDGATEVKQVESMLTKKQRDIHIHTSMGICTPSPAHT